MITKKNIALVSLLGILAAPAYALDQSDLKAAFTQSNAPKAGNVYGVTQKGDNILVLENDGINSYNGLNWSPLEIALHGDEEGLAAVPSKNGPLNPGDLLTTTADGLVAVYRQNEAGAYENTGIALSLYNPTGSLVQGMSFNKKNLEVLTQGNNLYDATFDGSVIAIDPTTGKVIGNVADLVGYTRISQSKEGELESDAYTIVKTNGKGQVVDSYTATLDDAMELLPPGVICTEDAQCQSDVCSDDFDSNGIPGLYCQ